MRQKVTVIAGRAYPGARTLECPECGGTMTLRPGPYEPGAFYGCENFPACRASHGAHPDGAPLGRPADGVTKHARIVAHDAFDALWKKASKRGGYPGLITESGKRRIMRRARKRAYHWLAEQMGLDVDDCHFGSFDLSQCRRATDICRGADPRTIRNWAKERGL